jgi:predicted Zn-dependent protease
MASPFCGREACGIDRTAPHQPRHTKAASFALASIEIPTGRIDVAGKAIRRALSLNPRYVWSNVLLATLHGLLGNRKEAQKVLAEPAQLLGSASKLIEIYRTIHLARFEQAQDAAMMTAGLRAIGWDI